MNSPMKKYMKKSRRVLRAGPSVCGVGVCHPPAHNKSSLTWKPSGPHCSVISIDASSCRHVKVKALSHV